MCEKTVFLLLLLLDEKHAERKLFPDFLLPLNIDILTVICIHILYAPVPRQRWHTIYRKCCLENYRKGFLLFCCDCCKRSVVFISYKYCTLRKNILLRWWWWFCESWWQWFISSKKICQLFAFPPASHIIKEG